MPQPTLANWGDLVGETILDQISNSILGSSTRASFADIAFPANVSALGGKQDAVIIGRKNLRDERLIDFQALRTAVFQGAHYGGDSEPSSLHLPRKWQHDAPVVRKGRSGI